MYIYVALYIYNIIYNIIMETLTILVPSGSRYAVVSRSDPCGEFYESKKIETYYTPKLTIV